MFKAIRYNPNDITTDFEYLIKHEKNFLFIYNENVELWQNKSTIKSRGLSLFKNTFYNDSVAISYQIYITKKLKEIAIKHNY